MFDLTKQNFEFKCPGCGAKNIASLGQVQNEEEVVCVNCKKSIKLKDEDGSTAKSIDDVNKAVQDLDNTLKNFGK